MYIATSRNIIKFIFKCLFPSLDVERLALPKELRAGYMRTEELRSICIVHKAYAQ